MDCKNLGWASGYACGTVGNVGVTHSVIRELWVAFCRTYLCLEPELVMKHNFKYTGWIE